MKIGKIFTAIGRWFVQHINLVILVLLFVECVISLYGSFSGTFAQRNYEKQKIINQTRIEKALTDKEIAILEAEKEAAVIRIKAGSEAGE